MDSSKGSLSRWSWAGLFVAVGVTALWLGRTSAPAAAVANEPAEATAPARAETTAPVPAEAATAPVAGAQAKLPGVYLDVPAGKPDGPWVIGLHGRGDSAAGFSSVPREWASNLNWRLLQAPLPWPAQGPRGFQWFTLRDPGVSDAQKATERAAASELLRAHIAELRKTTKQIVLFGFSQGCFLAAWYASQHPADVDAVLCFGGGMPSSEVAALPAGQRSPRIHFVHGEGDRMIEPRWSEEAQSLLQSKGFSVDRSLFAGGHTLPVALRPQLAQWLGKTLGVEVAFDPGRRMMQGPAPQAPAAPVPRSP